MVACTSSPTCDIFHKQYPLQFQDYPLQMCSQPSLGSETWFPPFLSQNSLGSLGPHDEQDVLAFVFLNQITFYSLLSNYFLTLPSQIRLELYNKSKAKDIHLFSLSSMARIATVTVSTITITSTPMPTRIASASTSTSAAMMNMLKQISLSIPVRSMGSVRWHFQGKCEICDMFTVCNRIYFLFHYHNFY